MAPGPHIPKSGPVYRDRVEEQIKWIVFIPQILFAVWEKTVLDKRNIPSILVANMI